MRCREVNVAGIVTSEGGRPAFPPCLAAGNRNPGKPLMKEGAFICEAHSNSVRNKGGVGCVLLHMVLARSLMRQHAVRSWAGGPQCSSTCVISVSSRNSTLHPSVQQSSLDFHAAAGFQKKAFQEDQAPNANTHKPNYCH
ncbi:uncharacterized protein LOC144220608 [Crocuta crocuta]